MPAWRRLQPTSSPAGGRFGFCFCRVPTQEVVWILREEYINGDAFTMGGDPMRLERIAPWQEKNQPPEPAEEDNGQVAETKPKDKGKVVVLSERKR